MKRKTKKNKNTEKTSNRLRCKYFIVHGKKEKKERKVKKKKKKKNKKKIEGS